MIKCKSKNEGSAISRSVEETMNDCEQYRKQLIQYCAQYFDYEYEYAEDCVQDAYVALLKNLNNGVEIKDYKAWLYTVVLNYKNKTIKDKIKRNELDFADTQEKEAVLENAKSYNPDYLDQMIPDKRIEAHARHILSQLTPEEKALYTAYYRKHKKLKDIAVERNVAYDTLRKRHEKLKKKLNKKIRDFENF